MKKILISGFTGMLGADLVRAFVPDIRYNVYGLSRNHSALLPSTQQFKVDLSLPDSVKDVTLQPDVIIHAAAITDLKHCEGDQELASRVHIEASEMLATSLQPRDRFIYISTDSVFDGKKGDYGETDSPNPLNAYALTKWKGEQVVQKALPARTTIVRTNIYGLHNPPGNSLAEWAIREWSTRKKISGFTDTIFNALFTEQLASVIKWLVDNDIALPILNAGSSQAISKFDFLDKLRQVLRIDAELLQPALCTDFNSAIRRPKDTSLNTTLLAGLYQVPDFESGINALAARARAQGFLPVVT